MPMYEAERPFQSAKNPSLRTMLRAISQPFVTWLVRSNCILVLIIHNGLVSVDVHIPAMIAADMCAKGPSSKNGLFRAGVGRNSKSLAEVYTVK